MKRIDRETVQRILDTADIVEVVSDFVNLKKRGANWIGLCPFHNERTPSFSVSKSKGICKCFSCGKGGSPVNFIMELEQMSFNEALRYLAKKYNIEIKEHEMTEEEQRQHTVRESLLSVNDFALNHFVHNLKDTADGRDIGLAYFRERGINDLMIDRFKLGYALEKSDDLSKAAKAKGYDEEFLVQTGLCSRSERGTLYDRFRGRVIYPVFSVSGRVIAFGGRTLRKEKTIAKYVNSPESEIYHKSNEVYGLYQAKSAIKKKEKCILVEGYMDVISMHQVGVDIVVASSGTSLTEGQIRQIHRFTDNITIIYDSDAAGIKASQRGIDLILAQGMNVKVLLLPEGEDPDSFAQSHSATEVEEYIRENETDFIKFKTDLLLKDTANDPLARAGVIKNIIESIALIPDPVLQAEYIRHCSRVLEISENVLVLQLQRTMANNAEKKYNKRGDYQQVPEQQQVTDRPYATLTNTVSPGQTATPQKQADRGALITAAEIVKSEQNLIKYLVKYAFVNIGESDSPEDYVTALDYVRGELADDGISFTFPAYAALYDEIINISSTTWPTDLQNKKHELSQKHASMMEAGREEIRQKATDLADIQAREKRLQESCDSDYHDLLREYSMGYALNILLSHPDDTVRRTSTDLSYEKYTLSKVHTKYAHIESEADRVNDLVPRAVLELKLAILNKRIVEVNDGIKHSSGDRLMELMSEYKDLLGIRAQFAKFLGERIVDSQKK